MSVRRQPATADTSRVQRAREAFAGFAGGSSQERVGGERLLGEIERVMERGRPRPFSDRALKTVLFSDIVDSTRRAAKLGDWRWRRVLEAHDLSVRSHVPVHGGRVLKSLGDGYLIAFDRPGRAIRCAHALGEDARTLGLQVKVGIHTGECEVI